tara:strand:- start:118 stop:1152 length:1035 start_codon:yes stop_codon:yes gene_type:complete
MKNKIIFFSIDRLGDYLIRSNVIKEISKNYINTEIISSDINFKLINSQTFFNKIIKFDTKNKNINKIKFIKNFYNKKYNSVICFDGKSISNFLLLIIKADFKHTFIYKKEGLYNKIKLKILLKILKILNISYTILYNRNLIEKGINENYPSKYKLLKKFYPNITNETYYLDNFYKSNIFNFKNYIVIHMDEKFCDINNVEKELNKYLLNLSKKIEKKIIITSYNNKNIYYKNLSIDKIQFDNYKNVKNILNKKIFILEEVPLKEFCDLIYNSSLNISCHAGFFVHMSLFYKLNTIDILNEAEERWVNSWISNKETYNVIYKSNLDNKIQIEEIFKKIEIQVNKQ